MPIKIGTISISLTAETSSFQQDMGKASHVALNSSRNIERSFKMMGAAIVSATGSAAASIGFLLDRTQEAVFNLQKMAQQAGTSVETFSKLRYAAKVAGLPIDQLSVIMARLAHNQMLAAGGSLEQAAAFKALGVNVTNTKGGIKDTGTLLLEVAKKLDQFKTSANKTGLETFLMGRSGAQAAELMSVLANRFDEVSREAQKLGVVFSADTAQKAQALHDSFLELEEAGLGLSVRLLSKVSPAVEELAQKLANLASNPATVKKLDRFGEDLATGIHAAGTAIDYAVRHLNEMKDVVEGLLAIRVVGMFAPMALSASTATNFTEKLTMAVTNLGGNLLGIERLGTNVLVPLAKGAKTSVTEFARMREATGTAAASSLYLQNSLLGIAAALQNVRVVMLPLLTALLAYQEITTSITDAERLHSETGASYWQNLKANIEYATTSLDGFKNTLEAVFGVQNAIAAEHKGIQQIVNGPDRSFVKPLARPGLPKGVPFGLDDKKHPIGGQKNAPGIHLLKQSDALQKKMAELTNAAIAAEAAFLMVGASPETQRRAAIQEKMNSFLAAQADLLQKLTPAQRAQTEAEALANITLEVNAKAAASYKEHLDALNQSLAESIAQNQAMADAVGKSAAAMQQAMIAARLHQAMQSTFGRNWLQNPQAVADATRIADQIRRGLNAANHGSDNKTLANLQEQLAAQQRLNQAILRGAAAMDAANVSNQKATIIARFKSRGDTDVQALHAQLRALDKLDAAKQEAADLNRAASFDAALRYRNEIHAIHDATAAAAKHGIALDYTSILAADHKAWVDFQNAQDQTLLNTGNMLDGLRAALHQMAVNTESDAQLMHDALLHGVNAINESLSTSLMAHANSSWEYKRHIVQSLSNASRGIGSSLLNHTFQKAEGDLLGKSFFGKPDGSSQKPFWVRLIDGIGHGAHSVGGLVGQVFHSKTGAGKSLLGTAIHDMSSTVTTHTSGVGHFFAHMLSHLPHFANGGTTVPGMPSIVGERGPELFVPPSAGRVIPNKGLRALGGDIHHWFIDATGSNDPAQTSAIFDRLMKKAAPQIATSAIQAIQQQRSRRPLSSRG